jgi:hypothetical protein
VPDDRSHKCKPARHEPKQEVVVPFPRKLAADCRPHGQATVDRYAWFRFRLGNGFTGAVPMLKQDVARISRAMQQPDAFHQFAVFDTPNRRIGLNLRHTTCTQFDGRPGAGLLAEAVPDTSTVDIMFSDSKEPLRIEVDPDEVALSVDAYEEKAKALADDAAVALVQVAILFSYCEAMHTGCDFVERLQDVSCSSIWIRLNDVALVSAPLGHIKAGRRKVKRDH